MKSTERKLDDMAAAHALEWERWSLRQNWMRKRGACWELVRNTSPDNDIIADDMQEIVTFTKRECPDKVAAHAWLNTYRARAAMRAALEKL